MLVPQLPQNFDPGATTDWHLGQVAATGIVPPHCTQNLLPSGTMALHFGQATIVGVGAAPPPPAAPPGPPGRPCAPMALAIMPGIIMPMPAPRPRPAALPASPGLFA